MNKTTTFANVPFLLSPEGTVKSILSEPHCEQFLIIIFNLFCKNLFKFIYRIF